MSAKANRIALAAIKAKLGTAPESVNPWRLMTVPLIAYHLGSWHKKTKFSLMDHYARGAGWEKSGAVAHALQHDRKLFNGRHQAAVARMFGERGVELDSASDDAKALAMFQLIDEAERAGVPLESG